MLTTFTGRVGDHNDRAMRPAALLGNRIVQRWGCEQQRVGTSAPALDSDSSAPAHRGITVSAYLGGMALDPAEQRLIDERGIAVLAPGPDFAERLDAVVGERPVYVHLDCDVLEPGIVPTDYRVPEGLDLTTLHTGLAALSAKEVIGLEVAELEDHPDARTRPELDALLVALSPPLDLVTDA